MAAGATSRDLKRAPRPDPPRPQRAAPAAMHLVPVRAASAPTVPNVIELGSEHLVPVSPRVSSAPSSSPSRPSRPSDMEARIRRLIAEELSPAGAQQREREEETVRFQLPPQLRGLRLVVVGAISFALVWNVTIGSYRAYVEAQRAHEGSAASASSPLAPAGLAAPHRCAAMGPRVLARAALVRGGVEAAASENRIALGVVTGAREGVAFELDPTSATVMGSTKVIASDALRRVLPALESDLPLDATPEVGPLRAVGKAGDDGEAYEAGTQDGFLVWRARGGEVSARLWPMTTEAEVPRVARVGSDDVLVFRRGDAIWMGTVHLDHDGARGGALVRISEPAAQVGSPSTDARGDTVLSAWSQRDTRGGRWTPRWARWRHDVRVGSVQQLTPPGTENAIAPSIAALAEGRFLLSWTEGGTGHHRVRAQLFGPSDEPLGAAFDVSAPDVDAGQAELAVGRDGHGAAGYLVARGSRFDLVATPIACE